MRTTLTFARYIAPLLLLAACAAGSENYTPQPITFNGRAPIRVNVAEIRIINAYQPPLMAPNVEQDFPTPPARAVEQWVHARLVAAGQQGVMEVSIDDASVREVPLPVRENFFDFFSDQQSARFDASVKVTFRLYNGIDALSVANAEAVVARQHTIGQKASIADRERVFDEMTKDMMTGFDAEAEMRLRQYFTPYLL